MTIHVVSLPYRGLKCRHDACQAELILARTVKDRRMPLERDPMALNAQDERGLFVILENVAERTTTAYGLTAARELVEITADTLVYRAHWSNCPGAAGFRRGR